MFVIREFLSKRRKFQNLLVWLCGVVFWVISAPFHHWNSSAQSALVAVMMIGIAYNSFHLITNPRRETVFNVFYVYWFMFFGFVFFVVTFTRVPDIVGACAFLLMIVLVLWGKLSLGGDVL